MGITYDEAYTFLAYAKPLRDDTTLWTLKNIWYTSVANNHWLYTILETILIKTTGILYNEFLIRIPSIIGGLVFYVLVYLEYVKDRINWLTFGLLIFNYYLNEFFSLGRGYGLSALLVLIGIILYDRYRASVYTKDIYLLISLGCLILSAYANSISLVACFCMGLIMLYEVLRNRRLPHILKNAWTYILGIVYALAGLVIVKFHFNVTKVGLGAYVADSVSLMGLINEHVGMLFSNGIVIRIISFVLIAIALIAVIVLIKAKALHKCDYSMAMMLYFISLILMITVFSRGGMTGRTLIPAFPLVAYGFGELVSEAAKSVINKDSMKSANIKVCKLAVAAGFITCSLVFVRRMDVFHVSDWYEDCEVKYNRHNADYILNENNASDVFYVEADKYINSVRMN